jgi:hypothetical protein
LRKSVGRRIENSGAHTKILLEYIYLPLLTSRDIDFDLENDTDRCLHGLDPDSSRFNPSDVQRVTQIFDHPQFFIDGAGANDIVQGANGDCWFISALSTLSTAEGLVEKSCVAVSCSHTSTTLLRLSSFHSAMRTLACMDLFSSAILPGRQSLSMSM